MRLIPIPPSKLTEEQQPVAKKIQQVIESSLTGFISSMEDGAFLGPFTPMLHFPDYGAAMVAFTEATSKNSTLPPVLREVAILVTGTHFRARYELYAHSIVAANKGLSASKISTICSGQRPADLAADEAVVYDITSALLRGGQLSDFTYKLAVDTFGDHGLAELTYLIGNYCIVSILLNTYDAEVPE
jgi:4-carboxymuconolactone decarboxylase